MWILENGPERWVNMNTGEVFEYASALERIEDMTPDLVLPEYDSELERIMDMTPGLLMNDDGV